MILIVLAGIIAGIFLTFYLVQEKIIFSPIKLDREYSYPFEHDFEERFYRVDEAVELNCLLFKAKQSKGLIFYIHGNADNLRYWGDFASFFLDHNYDVFMYDFRGFGKSGGKIRSEREMQRDAKRLYEIIIQEYTDQPIIIYGFSIGTGIASRLAMRQSPDLLILEAPYFNFISLVNYHKSYLPARLISKYRFRTNRYLKRMTCPSVIFHGTEDKKVPFYLGERLAGINPQLEFVKVEGATHNEMQSMEVFQEKIKSLLA